MICESPIIGWGFVKSKNTVIDDNNVLQLSCVEVIVHP